MAPVMTGSIVLCCTWASMRRTTCPPRWIRPRTGGLSFSDVPRPGAPASLRRRPSRPFGHGHGLALVPGHHVNLVDLHLTRQPGCWSSGDEATAQMLRHGLHVRGVEAEFCRDLPVREVQAHKVEAQHPHPQRLMVPGQRRAGKVVEAPSACLAAIPLAMRLGVVAPVADHRITATPETAHALRPAKLAHQREALGVVQQPREVDQIGRSHDDEGSSREPDGCSCSSHHTRCPASTLLKPTTPEANKSLKGLRGCPRPEIQRVFGTGSEPDHRGKDQASTVRNTALMTAASGRPLQLQRPFRKRSPRDWETVAKVSAPCRSDGDTVGEVAGCALASLLEDQLRGAAMSLRPAEIAPVPATTAQVAVAAFPRGCAAMRMRDELGAIYDDQMFAALFPVRGQPAYSPWRLALVTVLQFAEGLPD